MAVLRMLVTPRFALDTPSPHPGLSTLAHGRKVASLQSSQLAPLRDSALSLQRLGPCGFEPWPGNFCRQQAGPEKVASALCWFHDVLIMVLWL